MRRVVIIFFLCFGFLSAQNFRLDVTHTKAEVNEKIAIQYSFNKGTLPENLLPKVENMLKVGGPSLMNGSSSINGVTTSTSQLTYEIVFTKPGTYTIPATTVKNSSGKYTCNSVTIQVVKGNNYAPIIPPGYEGKELLIVMESNKQTVYIGEPVAIDLMVYCIFNNVTMTDIQYPNFDGGWTKDATDAFNDQLERTTYRGKPYNKWAFKRVWMIPSILGKTEFKPVRANFHAAIQHQTAGYLEFSFSPSSDPVTFDVINVPVENKPSSYINAVGEFTWNFRLDKTNAKANEPIKAMINIEGIGNLPTLESPPIILPDEFEIFEPKVTNNQKVEIKGINGTKGFEYLIMPRKEGEYWLGPFSFSYFNPQTKKYTELKSDSFQVNIKGVIADTTTSANVVNNGKFEGGKIWKKFDPFFGNPFYYILLGLPFLAGLGMIIFRKRLFFTKKDDSEKKLKQAEDKANKALQEAKGSVDKLSAVFFQYISDKFKTTRNEITRANLQKWLPDTNTKLLSVKIMDMLDQFRFAPAAASDLDSLYNNIKNFVDELGRK